MRENVRSAIADEAELRALVARYARGVDRARWDLVRSCFHPDAQIVYGLADGGPEDLIAYASEGLRDMTSLMHVMHQTLLVVDGDVASGETYATCHHRFDAPEGPTDMVVGARYVDRFERRSSQWRIAKRTMVYEWTRIDPVDRTFTDPRLVLGTRDDRDPSLGQDVFLP